MNPPPPFWTKVGDLNREINIQGPEGLFDSSAVRESLGRLFG